MTDFLQTKRDEITVRLRELEPLATEYRQLEAAAAALDALPGSVQSAGAGTSSGRRASARLEGTARTTRKRPRGRPRGSGTRALQAIELVKARPGITITELASAMGIKQNYLYRVLPGLAKDKRIVKRGKGWHPGNS